MSLRAKQSGALAQRLRLGESNRWILRLLCPNGHAALTLRYRCVCATHTLR